MARVKERIVMALVAVTFVGSSLALSFFVIWQMVHDKGSNKVDQTTASPAQAADQNNQSNQPKEGKLAGTKLEGFSPVGHVESLQIVDLQPGTGSEVKAADTITADYTGALASSGVIFQSSLDSGKPFTSPLAGLIPGWQQGIPGMKVGGKRRLIIPAAQAYGNQAQSGIPANSDLVFDITLHTIGQ